MTGDPRASAPTVGPHVGPCRGADGEHPLSTRRVGIELPIFLWALIAVGAHFVWAGGSVVVTLAEENLASQRADIREMVSDVRKNISTTTIEIDDTPDTPTEEERVAVDVDQPPVELPTGIVPSDESDETLNPPTVAATPEQEEPEQQQPAPEEEKEPEPEKAKPTEVVIVKDKRLAIRQATKPNQADNPNAPRVADQANTVEDETQARLRSTDSVSADPSLGEQKDRAEDDEGNSSKTKVEQAEVAEGDKQRAPGEAADSTDSAHHAPHPPHPAVIAKGATGQQQPGKAAASGAAEQLPSPAVAESPGASGTPSPAVVTGDEGYSQKVPDAGGEGYGSVISPVIPGSPGAPYVPFSPTNLGLGLDSGAGAGMNVPWSGFVAAVGDEALDAQRAAMGESIRSEKRGKHDYDKFQRWKPDIENYDPSVKLGNQTALNAAQQVGAGYLSTIHNAIHPIFAEEFLALLDNLPKGHVLNTDLVAHVEIILDKDGNVVRMGITKQSGSTMFDASALEAIDRAEPFGKAPTELASTDGFIYLHWEFHRDPVDACTTRNAQPFILKDPKPITSKRTPKKKQKKTTPPPTPKEGAPGQASTGQSSTTPTPPPEQGTAPKSPPKTKAPPKSSSASSKSSRTGGRASRSPKTKK